MILWSVDVIHRGVGAITESDILLARASGAIIVGFHVRPDNNARAAAERLRARGLEVEAKVCHAQAADALIEEAKHADLLVVGSRGHGGFAGLLLGSVSQQCAQHAPCPTVIVR